MTALLGLREHFSLTGAAGIPVGLYVSREAARGRGPAETIAGLAGAAVGSTAATMPLLIDIADAIAGADPTSLDEVRQVSPSGAAALDRYLADYGERVVGAFDVTGRRLIELPELVMRSITTADRRNPACQPSAPDGVADGDDPIADDARLALASRDDHAGISCMWPLGLTRRALLAAGRRLRAAGRLAEDVDALVCSVDEIVALLGGAVSAPSAASISQRVTVRRHLRDIVPPSALGDVHAPPDPTVFPPNMRRVAAGMIAFLGALERSSSPGGDVDAVPAGSARGTGIGQGRHRGRAVVARDPEDAIARLEPGDVLITSTTTPAFNSVLPIVGALVTAHGGSMSHAGIAARELGVPAVVGAAGVVELIRDGATVEVDAPAGTVREVPAG